MSFPRVEVLKVQRKSVVRVIAVVKIGMGKEADRDNGSVLAAADWADGAGDGVLDGLGGVVPCKGGRIECAVG